MAFLFTISGTYRYRVRTKILWFWVVQPWKTQRFTWSRPVEAPDLHLSHAPIRGVPISISLDVDDGSAHCGLKLNNGIELWGQTLAVPANETREFKFEPWKGVILEGRAEFIRQ